ncbi:MAG: hypothetical protein CL608_07615 [Anaerolineaceae bacterium]|nr:hypothetical protein [Anaerolineaceae bacterium]
MSVEEKQIRNLKGITHTPKHLFLVFVVIFLFIAGCQEKQPDDEQLANPETEVTATAVPTEAAAAVATEAVPEMDVEPLPANVNLVGDVYMVDGEDTAVAGQLTLDIPEDANPALLDLYGWDGTAWAFVPSQYDPATQQQQAANQGLYQALALVQVDAPDEITVGGLWHAEASTFTEATVSTLQLGADGALEGSLSEVPAGLANPYVQLTNVGDEIDAAALSAFLADESAQTAQIEAIVDMIEPYAGVNLNYQGVGTDDKAAFTTFVQNLADALAAQEKMLILTLPAPQNTDATSADGYDWTALGNIAHSVYLQLPLDPNGYAAGGAIDQLLNWATDNMDRRKLVALIPTGPVVRSGEAWVALSADEQLSHFGDLQADASEYEPETPIEVTLSGDISLIQWDEASSAYYYTVEDSQEVWLTHPATIAFRMETAVNHNLQGVAFTTPVQLSDSAQADAPALVWTVLDDAENVVVTKSGSEPSFSWEGTAEPGEFTLQVDFVSGDVTTALGTLPITAAAVEDAEEVAESDDDTVVTTGIVTRNANVRIGPAESFDKFPGPILKDTEVEIIGRDEFGYWLQINFTNIDGEQTGWIATSLVDLDPEFDINTLVDATEMIASASETTVAEAPPPASAPAPTPAATTPAAAPPSGPPPPVSAPPVAVGGFELGGQTHSFSNPTLMASAGMTWVKFQHKWGEGNNPNDLAGRINNAHAAGFKVLLSIPGANTYPESINFDAYVQFLAGVAALGPDAIEIWNEMNIDFEWPAGQIDPASYVNNMLAPAYNAIKAANPNVMVISGAPAPTGFDNGTNAWADNRYMSGMLAAGAASYADCIGAHYNAGASSPSTVSGHPTGSAHYSWYLLPTLNVYAQLGKPVCFTELGYLSGDDYGGVPERFGWAAGTTVAQHAAWLAEAVSVAANTGRVRMIIVFNVDFTHYGDDPQAGYAMIRANGGCPACETLARVMGR